MFLQQKNNQSLIDYKYENVKETPLGKLLKPFVRRESHGPETIIPTFNSVRDIPMGPTGDKENIVTDSSRQETLTLTNRGDNNQANTDPFYNTASTIPINNNTKEGNLKPQSAIDEFKQVEKKTFNLNISKFNKSNNQSIIRKERSISSSAKSLNTRGMTNNNKKQVLKDEKDIENFDYYEGMEVDYDSNKIRTFINKMDYDTNNILKKYKFRGTRWGHQFRETMWDKKHCHDEDPNHHLISHMHPCDSQIMERQNSILQERKGLMEDFLNFYEANKYSMEQFAEMIILKYIDLKSTNEKIRIKSTSMEAELNKKNRLLKSLQVEVKSLDGFLSVLSKNESIENDFKLFSEETIARGSGL